MQSAVKLLFLTLGYFHYSSGLPDDISRTSTITISYSFFQQQVREISEKGKNLLDIPKWHMIFRLYDLLITCKFCLDLNSFGLCGQPELSSYPIAQGR